jgi:hypothetical protein
LNRIFDFLVFSLVVAGIMVLTRPGSQGPRFVSAVGNAIAQVINAATGTPTGATGSPPRRR